MTRAHARQPAHAAADAADSGVRDPGRRTATSAGRSSSSSTAGVTDGLDGLIARRSGQKTSLGAWLDPMADKLLLVTHVHRADASGPRPRQPVADLADGAASSAATSSSSLTVAIVNLAIGRRTFRPSIFGKIATATYIVTAVAAMLFNYLGYHSVIVDVVRLGVAGDHAGLGLPLHLARAPDHRRTGAEACDARGSVRSLRR